MSILHNYVEIAAMILFGVGFTTLLLHKNMIKKIIGFSIMDNAIFLFLAAKGYIEGTIKGRNDGAKLAELFQAKIPGAVVANYTNAEGTTFDNYYTILLAPVDFNDYLAK